MGFRINTNISSISAQRSLAKVSRNQLSTLGKLSSGSRINRASDDAAGLAISEKLRAGIRSLKQANRNANDGVSMIQTAEGGLGEITNILVRLRELAIQSSSDTVGDSERTFSDLEFQNLKQEIERISQVAEFNGKKILNGQGDFYEFQIGINNDPFQDRIVYDAKATNSTLDGLGITGIAVNSKGNAQNSLENIDAAIQTISAQRANLGAIQNRLTSTSENIEVTVENLSDANSRIRDADFAEETAANTRFNILQQAGVSVLSQANMSGAAALRLISQAGFKQLSIDKAIP